jgi:hypothetical protein
MTSLIDLNIAVATIIEITGATRPTKWIYGADFKQLLDAIKVFRAYYWERKDSYGIPQSLFDELDGYIANFPAPYYHYTDKAGDQNNMVDALMVIGKMSAYGPPPPPAGELVKILVHWLNPDGSIKQTFDYWANQKAKIPHWIQGTDYVDGNVKIEMVWSALSNKSIRFDKATYLHWVQQWLGWENGSCISTPLIQNYSLYRYLKMPTVNTSQYCRIMDCDKEIEYVNYGVLIEVSDVSPPPVLTGTFKGQTWGVVRATGLQPSKTSKLSGVKVSVANLSTTSDADGYFQISNIPVGFHIISYEKSGYRTVKEAWEIKAGCVIYHTVYLYTVTATYP